MQQNKGQRLFVKYDRIMTVDVVKHTIVIVAWQLAIMEVPVSDAEISYHICN